MVNYDSDSEDENENYTETNTLLGYVSQDASSDDVSFIGGRPQWLDASKPPSAALARCRVCRDMMVLLLQLNGELPEFPGHERRLYILSCKRKTCQRREGSIRALRGVRINQLSAKEKAREEKKTEKPVEKAQSNAPSAAKSTGVGESLFGAKPSSGGANLNPFSSGGIKAVNPFSSPTGIPSNPFSSPGAFPALSELAAKPAQKPASETSDLPKSFATALSLNNTQKDRAAFGPAPPPEPWPQESELPSAYPILYFDTVEKEQLDEDEDEDMTIPPVTMELDDETGSGSGPQKEDKDTYESTIDKEFQKFADRLSQNPEQVIRYEFAGQPLLYSKSDAVGKLLSPPNHKSKITTSNGAGSRIPRCKNCGAGRVFEMQMTPHAILELESEDMSLDGMEWGTIIVGVCENDCTTSGTPLGEPVYLEEWAGVQWEELTEKR